MRNFLLIILVLTLGCVHGPGKKAGDQIDRLIIATQDKDPVVAETAYVELSRIGDRDPCVFDFFSKRLKKPQTGDARDHMEIRGALIGLHSMMDKVPPLVPLIKKQVSDAYTRPYALNILWKLAEQDADLRAYFKSLENSDDLNVRQDALRFSGQKEN